MARFEYSKRRWDSRERSPKREGRREFSEDRPRREFGEDSPRREFSRESKHNSRNRRDFRMTKVTCDSCGIECEVPFKPTSDKPVYCEGCFAKKDKRSSHPHNNHHPHPHNDLDTINEKLNKIMKALKIE